MRKKYPIKINFLTTTFPKFIGDSHAPWILNMAQRLYESGYEIQVITPSAYDLKDNDIFKNFSLQSNNQLDAVELTYEMPVVVSGDTLVYDADSFKTGTERKLEDVLKNFA